MTKQELEQIADDFEWYISNLMTPPIDKIKDVKPANDFWSYNL